MRLGDVVGNDLNGFVSKVWRKKPAQFKSAIASNIWPNLQVDNLATWFDPVLPNIKLYKVESEDGELYEYDLPLSQDGSLDVAEVTRLYREEGVSTVIKRLHKVSGAIGEMAFALALNFRHEGYICDDVNAFITPPASQALKAHLADCEVFAFQLLGRKMWFLGDEGKQSELVMEDGDVLYMPEGCRHEARSFNDLSSIHISFLLHRPGEGNATAGTKLHG